MPHGLGKFLKVSNLQAGQNYEYIGEFYEGLRHGELGKCFFKDGSFYAGSWKNDMMDSNLQSQLNSAKKDCIFIQNDGRTRYFGQFKVNKRHGPGILYEEEALSSSTASIKIKSGTFNLDQLNGSVVLQVYRKSKGNSSLTTIEKYQQVYSMGTLKSS